MILRNSVKLTLWLLLRAALQAVTVVLLARLLGAHDYGRYVAALAIATSFAPVLLGGPGFVYLEGSSFGLSRPQMATIWLRLLVIAGGVGSALTPIVVGLATQDWTHSWLWLAVGASEIIFIGLTEVIARHYQAEQSAHGMGFWQCAPHLLRLAVLLIWVGSMGRLTLLEWIVASTGSCLIAGCIAAVRMPRASVPGSQAIGPWSFFKVSLHYGSGGVAARLLADGDKPLVSRFDGPAITGSLSLAQRIVDLTALPLNAVLSTALPQLLRANSQDERRRAWRAALTLPMMYSALVGLIVVFLAAPLMSIFGPEYAGMSGALQAMAWLPLAGFVRGTLGNRAAVAGRGDIYARGHWLGAAIRIGACFVLLPAFGWPGAIIALLFAETSSCLYLWLAVNRTTYQEPSGSKTR